MLSGLSCNVEKTCVMRIGNLDGEIPDEIKELGFTFVDEMVRLGFKLSNSGNMSALNFDPVVEKFVAQSGTGKDSTYRFQVKLLFINAYFYPS